MKKLLLVIGAVLLLSGCVAVPGWGNKIGNKPAHRTTENFVYQDLTSVNGFANVDRRLCGAKSAAEIKKLNDSASWDNFQKFPEFAGYYLPNNLVTGVERKDIDNDKQEETIIYYTCPHCNAPPRGLDVVKGGKVVFTAQGGNLEIKPVAGESAFLLNVSGLTISRDQGYTTIKFQKNEAGEFRPVTEDDVKY